MNKDCIINTELGDILGFKKDGVNYFLGIPYSSGLGAEKRFCSPEPIEPWEGILDATTNKPIPPQRPSRLAKVMGDFSLLYNEDCLTLNIWSPTNKKEKLPVIFWIHGGAFVSGSGSLDWYSGESFARDQEIILVGINYRLGALGFLYHPDISKGNMGIQDQILALEWVSKNIESFGGDSANITIMGQSAGARSAFALLANNKARHFIKNVIFQSGFFNSFETRDVASEKAEKFAKIAGVKVKQLKKISVEDILDTQTAVAQTGAIFASVNVPFFPVIDGEIIPANTHAAALEGAADKCIMLGTTHDEMHAFLSGNPEIETAPLKKIEEVFRREFINDWEIILKNCQRRAPGATSMEILSLGLNIAFFEGQTAAIANDFAEQGIDAWLYRFDWKSPASAFGACHCIELPFLFNTFKKWLPPMIAGLDLNEGLNLSKVLQKTWGTFAKYGDPNHDDIAYWPKFSEKQHSEIHWNKYIEVIQKPR